MDEIEEWTAAALVREDAAAAEAAAAEAGAGAKVHLLSGMNSDSGNWAVPAHFSGLEKLPVHCSPASGAEKEAGAPSRLFEALAECRVTKTEAEVELLR